jgi:hypothetical protein
VVDTGNIPTLVAMAAVIFAVYSWSQLTRSRMRQRIRELSAAKEALELFYDTSDRLLDDPELDTGLREHIARLVLLVMDREASHEFLRFLIQHNDWNKKDNRLSAAMASDGLLRKVDPRYSDEIGIALSAGLLAIFMRWPENARLAGKPLPPVMLPHERFVFLGELFAFTKSESGRIRLGLSPAGT